uniref:Uncharacterized protein n=1 Tax=Steinernema glaseri TaxID=37863 RepID=A0A1I7YQ57_9BILA
MGNSLSAPRDSSEQDGLLQRQLGERSYGAVDVLRSTPIPIEPFSLRDGWRSRFSKFNLSDAFGFTIAYVFLFFYALLQPLRLYISDQFALGEQRRRRVDCIPKTSQKANLRNPTVRCVRKMRGFSNRRTNPDY